MKSLLEFLSGFCIGMVLSLSSFIVFIGVFEPDPLQEQANRKAYCQAVEEYLSSPQDPEERIKFFEKHKENLVRCDQISKR